MVRVADLRESQLEVTRGRIMEALASIVARDGLRDFSVQEVADRAGVSHRTVYRHYRSRGALLRALAGWLESRFESRGGAALPASVEGLPELVERNFAVFGEEGELIRALTAVEAGARVLAPYRERRSAAFRNVLAREVAGHLGEPDLAAVVGVVRLLVSSRAWQRLHDENGVETPVAGRAVAWALRVLLDDLRAGGGPDTRPRRVPPNTDGANPSK